VKLMLGFLFLLGALSIYILQSLLILPGPPISIHGGPFIFVLLQISLVSDSRVIHFIKDVLVPKIRDGFESFKVWCTWRPNKVQPASQDACDSEGLSQQARIWLHSLRIWDPREAHANIEIQMIPVHHTDC
jgi:hypothetical protein